MGCSMNASIESLNPVATISLQKKIYFDVNDPTNVSMVEGSFAVVNIALDSKSETDTKIDIVLNGQANRFEALESQLIIPAGSLSKSVVLQTKNDSIYQGLQEFTLIASKVGETSESEQARLIIKLVDDESMPLLSIAASSANENAGSMIFSVSMNRTSALDTDFYYSTTDLTALAGSDYTIISLVKATIPAGQTSVNVSVSLLNDSFFEADETFSIALSSPVNADLQTASALGTILNDDVMPSVEFLASSSSQGENAGSIAVQLNLSAVSNVDVSVPYTLSGTATSVSDFSVSLPSPIVIPAGTTSKSFSLIIVDDSVSEFSETAILTIGTPSNASVGVKNTYTLTITDNDMAVANFASASQTVSESSGTWGSWPASMSAWSKRRTIEVIGLSSSITNFPVLVKLDSSRINYAQTQSQGQDLRFLDDTGTQLSYEIENWNSSGTSNVWVKVPSIAASPSRTRIWVYYGNPSASDAQDKVNVWESNYKGVWHLNGNAYDSTSNVKDGTGTGVSYSAGAVGQALTLNGVLGNNLRLPDSMTTANILTISVSFKSTASGVIFGHTNTLYSVTPAMWDPLLYIDNLGRLRGGDYAGGAPAYVSSQSVNDGQWHQAVWVGNTNTQSLYLDGALVGTFAGTLGMSSMLYNYLGMGHWEGWPTAGSAWNTFNGSIDEVSISSNVRNASWVQYQYASMNDMILTYGVEEIPSTGLVNVLVQLDSPAVNTVTVPYTVSGTATVDLDHTLATGVVTISTGNSSASIGVRILKDKLTESNETIIITMGTPTNAVQGSTTQHTMTITDEVNANPIAVTDNITVTSTSANFFEILANDTDAENDLISISSVSAASSGTVTFLGKKIAYTPSTTFAGTDTFTYSISDGRGGTATGTVNVTMQIPFTWTGAADSSWTNTANWIGGVLPANSNTIFFNNQCSANCNPQMQGNVSVKGVRIDASYTGTFAQASTRTLTIGTNGWVQNGGTFVGGDSSITHNGAFNLSGGSYKNSSALNIFGGSFTDSGAGTFDGSVGSTRFQAAYQTSPSITVANRTFSDLSFYGNASNFYISGTLNTSGLVLRNSDYGCGLQNGIINVSGDLTIDPNTNSAYTGCDGSSQIRIVGSGNQNITGNSYSGRTPKLEIASTGGTVYLASGISIWNGFKHTSGSIDPTTSIVKLHATYGTSTSIDFNSTPFNQLYITGSSSTINASGTAIVSSDLHLSNRDYNFSYIYNGQIDVLGNVYADGGTTSDHLGMAGSTLVRLVGSSPQTIYGIISANYYGLLPKVTINSTSTVTMANKIRFRNTLNNIASAGIITTGSTISFNAGGATINQYPNGIVFNNLEVGGNSVGTLDFQGATLTVGGTMYISDSFGCYVYNGTFEVSGNLVSGGTSGGCLGNAAISLVGGANATISATTTNALYYFPAGTFTINKPGATVTLTTKFSPNSTGQLTNLVAGSINVNGQLFYTKSLSLNGNTVYLNSGTLYVNGSSVADGSPYGGIVSP